jgi:Domain of unknown function (DUF4160)
MMPTVFRHGPHRFFFFANEGFEPPHIHVEADDAYAKLWLNPVSFAGSTGFNGKEMGEIRRLVEQHRDKCEEAWDEFFSRKA